MTTYLCHFHVVSGVSLTLDLVLESKHYSEDALAGACHLLADKLGINFVYWEVKP
jgi:hypothetical protein